MRSKFPPSVGQFLCSCAVGTVGERTIISVRSVMNRDRAVAELALTSCTMYRPKVTPAQAEKGRRWLLDGSLTKAGALRKTPLVNSLRALSVIRDATTARLIGFENVATFDALLLGFSYYLPIYEYATRDGRTFTYCPRPGGIVTNY